MLKVSQRLIPIQTRSDGEAFNLQVIDIDSGKPGPLVYLQAGLHGNELQGNALLIEFTLLLQHLNWKGTIRIVPIANPLGTSQKLGDFTSGRFDPISGDNFNRATHELAPSEDSPINDFTQIDIAKFVVSHKTKSLDELTQAFKTEIEKKLKNYLTLAHSYPQKLCATLQLLAAPADIVIDLHTAPIATDYIYTTEKNLPHAKNFLFPYYLVMEESYALAMDEAVSSPWWELQKEINKLSLPIQIGFEAYTLELGSEEVFDLDKGKLEALKVLNYLKSKNIITDKIPEHPTPPKTQWACHLDNFKTIFAPTGGLFHFNVKPGDKKLAGELLGSFYNWKNLKISPHQIEHRPYEIIASEDLIILNRFSSSSIPEGADIFQVMTQFWEIT